MAKRKSKRPNLWTRLPLYARAVISAVALVALLQLGFALLNPRSTPVNVLGAMCLLAAPYVAYRAGKHLIREINT